MPGMPMPGGWTMSTAWMLPPGDTWAGAAASFVGMWAVMMTAMMAPSLIPVLWRYRRGLAGQHASTAHMLTAVVALAYLSVWFALGVAIFPVGAATAAATMQLPLLARAVPILAVAVIVSAGALQFTRWKARRLACCRASTIHAGLDSSIGDAWRRGTRMGLDCAACCGGFTAILLVVGVMDVAAMVAVTTAITLERLAPAGERVARVVGGIAIGTGLWLLVA